jgi:hypothetical protein
VRDRPFTADVLSLAPSVWRCVTFSAEAFDGTGEGVPASGVGGIRSDTRQAQLNGGNTGELPSPPRRCRCIDHKRQQLGGSEHRWVVKRT